MLRFISDLVGTAAAYFRIGFAGPRLKASGANLLIRNSGDSADAEITAAKVNVSGESVVVNSDAAGSGADWAYTLTRPTSGMSAAVTLTLPPTDGSPDEVLSTDGNGNLTFVAAGSTAACDKVDTTALAFGDSSPVAMFTLPANAVITKIQVIVDTAFDGTAPTVSIGISGTTSKYMAATDINLKVVGIYEVSPGAIAVGTTEALIATYAADSSAAGAARIVVYYSVPT